MGLEYLIAGAVLGFGILFATKELFDLYLQREEMKARLDYIHRLEMYSYAHEIDDVRYQSRDPDVQRRHLY